MGKSIGVYVRISTIDQNADGQIDELKAWLDRNGISPETVEWFQDEETGKTLNRKSFNRLRAEVDAGRITTVICYKVDRLSRTMLDGMLLVSEWVKRGVRVVSVTQQVDMSGVIGQMMASLLFGFAQIEMEYRVERQRAGITAAKRKGKYTGRKPGTTKGKPQRAADLRVKGLTVEEIATAMGTSRRTVHRYLAA